MRDCKRVYIKLLRPSDVYIYDFCTIPYNHTPVLYLSVLRTNFWRARAVVSSMLYVVSPMVRKICVKIHLYKGKECDKLYVYEKMRIFAVYDVEGCCIMTVQQYKVYDTW